MLTWVLLVAQTVGLSLVGAPPPLAVDEVVLTLDVRGRTGERELSASEELLISGQVTPVQGSEGVIVSFYHVRDESTWVVQGRVDAGLDSQGRFSIIVHPRSSGWKPGTLRVVATSRHLRTLRESSDLRIIPAEATVSETKTPPATTARPAGFGYAQIELQMGDSSQAERYDSAASIAIIGRVQPVLPRGEKLAVRILHIGVDATQTLQGGVDLVPRPDGQFSVTIDPPSPGWQLGFCHISVSAPRMGLQGDYHDIHVVPRPDQPDRPEWTVRPFVDSGVIIDTEEPVQKVPTVPVESEFRVRGRYRLVGGRQGDRASGVIAHLKQGRHPKAPIAQSAVTKGYCESPDHWWFEMTLKAPEQPGRYHLVVRTPRPGGGNPADVESHFVGDVIVAPAAGER